MASTSSSVEKEAFIIKGIETTRIYGEEKTLFVVKSNDSFNSTYYIVIDNAIAAKEVEPCTYKGPKQSTDGRTYSASNGRTYRIGDHIKPNKGSGFADQFRFIHTSKYSLDREARTDSDVSSEIFTLEKIEQRKINGHNKVFFVVKSDDSFTSTYYVVIEDAIAAKEIFSGSYERQRQSTDGKTYKANNGYTYRIGDHIKPNKGSAFANRFQFIQTRMEFNASSDITREIFTLKKIENRKVDGHDKVFFVVESNDSFTSTYYIAIEDAIAAKEIFSGSYERQRQSTDGRTYSASNGRTYRIGDHIKPNKGSGFADQFRFIHTSKYSLDREARTDSDVSSEIFTLEKIEQRKINGHDKVVFTVESNDSFTSTYYIVIDDAIAAKEIFVGN